MSLILILSMLFFSVTVLAYCCLFSASSSVDNFSQTLSATTESHLRNLFLVADARKLSVLFFLALLMIPGLLFVFNVSLLLVCVAIVLIILAPRVIFARLNKTRRIAINAALPDALSQISGAMKAGSTFTLGIESYSDEVDGPLAQEFSLFLRELRLGAQVEDALENLGERVKSEEMDLVISAAMIAHEIGGNLAEILQGLSDTIRRKLEMEGKIDALTAQGRLQGRVVAALPFLILLPLLYFEPAATKPLFSSLLGWLFLCVIVGMDLTGSVMIKKIVSIDV